MTEILQAVLLNRSVLLGRSDWVLDKMIGKLGKGILKMFGSLMVILKEQMSHYSFLNLSVRVWRVFIF
jgi:hypothetical protein